MRPGVKKRIPKRLAKEPLLEAVWELRFRSSTDTVESLLSGIVYDKMGDLFERPVRLSAADIPAAARAQQPMLNYAPVFRFDGKGQHACYGIQVGPRAITLNCRKPYAGWDRFRGEIAKLAELVHDSGLAETIDRFSLKYVDLIPADAPDYTLPLDGAFRLGPHNLGTSPLQMQAQISDGVFIHLITLLAPARVQMEQESLDGLIIDIDAIAPAGSGNFWADHPGLLDRGHDANHAMFF